MVEFFIIKFNENLYQFSSRWAKSCSPSFWSAYRKFYLKNATKQVKGKCVPCVRYEGMRKRAGVTPYS
jgi:hypothetical protein